MVKWFFNMIPCISWFLKLKNLLQKNEGVNPIYSIFLSYLYSDILKLLSMTYNTGTMEKQRWVTGEAWTLTFSRTLKRSKIQSMIRGIYLFDCDTYDRFSSLRPTVNQNFFAAIHPITALQPDPKQSNLKCVEYSHFYPSNILALVWPDRNIPVQF